MFKFLLKVWGLARPYRGRLFLGVLTGIVAGVMEPLMIATVAFVYGLIFPSAEPNSSLLRAEHFKDAPALITRLNNQSEPFSEFLWSQFSAENRQLLTKAVAASNRPPAVLVQDLNRLIVGDSLYEAQRLGGVELGQETRLLLAENPQGERLIRLNRLLLEDAYPRKSPGIFRHPWPTN